MSGYGWLTESTLMPKKSKSIKVDDQSSLFGLKAIISRQKQKMVGGQSRKIYEIKKTVKKNPGVEERAKKDQRQKIISKVHDSARMLHIKQKLYGSLQSQKRNVGKLLVNFQEKVLLQEDNGDYQKLRDQFYSGKLEQIQKQRQQIGNNIGEQGLRQRLAWQRQALGKLKGDFDEKQKVKQVFDKKMHQEEKKALEDVVKQFAQQQKKIEQVKRRRQQLQDQRLKKLQKLNIIPSKSDQIIKQELKKEQK